MKISTSITRSDWWVWFALMLRAVLVVQTQPLRFSSLTTFNFMNCMDFARHMSSTAERFGLLSSVVTPPVPNKRQSFDLFLRNHRRYSNRKYSRQDPGPPSQPQPIAPNLNQPFDNGQGGLVDMFQNLFNQVLNIGDSNVAACNQRPKLIACQNIDSYLESIFPEWWFNMRITDNANYVASQLTSHRYHSLVEAAMKAYKCFCQC
ncbi:halfway protein [Sarcoptes scabiei]|nr:halfway protein [Sarcoptes scabiei]